MKQIFPLILACICMLACRQQTHQTSADIYNHDLTQIKDSGVLVALTLNSSISYFDYRGEPWDSNMNLPINLPNPLESS